MKKSIMLLSLVVVGVMSLTSIASAVALSSVTTNVTAITTAAAVTFTAPYGSEWVVVPAGDVYVNQLNAATPNTSYPLLTSTNTYALTVNRGGRLIVLAKQNANLTFVPAAAYIPAR